MTQPIEQQHALAFGSRSWASRFLTVLLAAFLLAGCGDDCTNVIESEATSPDGKFVATAFIREGNATTGFSPQVYLRPAGEPMARFGNVFIGDHSDEIRVEWLSASRLVIYATCSVIRQETNYHGIAIEKREWK